MTRQCQAHSWRLTEAGVVALTEGPVEVTGMKGQQEGRAGQRPGVRRGWVPCAPGGSGLRWPEGSWWERVAPAGSEPPRAGGDQVKAVTQVVEDWGMSGPRSLLSLGGRPCLGPSPVPGGTAARAWPAQDHLAQAQQGCMAHGLPDKPA